MTDGSWSCCAAPTSSPATASSRWRRRIRSGKPRNPLAGGLVTMTICPGTIASEVGMAYSVVDGEGLGELRRRAAAQTLTPAVDVFLFLRHGRTSGNAQRIFQRPDEPLDDHGVGQAERAAAILSGA